MRKIVSGNGSEQMLPKPAVIMTVPVAPELKELIGKAADEEGVPMNEWLSRVAAEALGRPDLARVPRKAYGRPRKSAVPA